MRLASFAAPGGAEISIVALPGEAGGDLANVNRWRGQLGLPAIGEAELAKTAKGASSPAGELMVVAFSSPEKGRMVGARLSSGGQTWFFKLTGSARAVSDAAPAFSKFITTLRPGESQAQPQEMPQMQGMPDMASAPAPSGGLGWKLPEGWKEEPGTGMRLATLRAPSSAEVSVVSLPGDAGGDLANVNRWRQQLDLPAIADADLASQAQRVKSPAGEVLVVDLASPAKGRMVAARLFASGQSWFFKLTGKDGAVASARPAFNGFLGSLRLEAK